jgi:hypothetical protein
MPRIQDIGAFSAVREAGLAKLVPAVPRIAVGMGTCGRGNGAEGLYSAFAQAIERSGADMVLVPVGCLPWLLGFAGLAYGTVAGLSGAVFVYRAWQTYQSRQDTVNRNRVAMRLFGFSILYLFALFAALLVERTVVLLADRLG